jgi:S-ribosylhomocysteine lyase
VEFEAPARPTKEAPVADINHRLMAPPSLRIQKELHTAAGDVVTWDLRVAQPNVSHVPMPVIHSMEHFLGTLLPELGSGVATVAPMGCQTGFYIVTAGLRDYDRMEALVAHALEQVLEAEAVPLANVEQCGWAENHTLVGAQRMARWLLDRRPSWAESAIESR